MPLPAPNVAVEQLSPAAYNPFLMMHDPAMRRNGWPVQPHPARRICRSCAKSRIHMLALAIDQIHRTLTALDNRQRFAIRAPRPLDGTRDHGGPFSTAPQCADSCHLSSGFRQTLLNVYLSNAHLPGWRRDRISIKLDDLTNRLNLFSHFVKPYIGSCANAGLRHPASGRSPVRSFIIRRPIRMPYASCVPQARYIPHQLKLIF